MRGLTQHEYVGAGAEHPVLQAGDDDRSDFWVFEANSLNSVGELDIDAKIVGIQFQLIAGGETAVLGDVHGQGGNWTVDVERPMPVFRWIRLEVDRRAPHSRAPTLSNNYNPPRCVPPT